MYQILNDGFVENPITCSKGICNGMGLYEAIKVVFDKELNVVRAEYLPEHYKRLKEAVEHFGFKCDLTLQRLEEAVSHIVVTHRPKNGAIKLMVVVDDYPNTKSFIDYQPILYAEDKYKEGFKLTMARSKRNPTSNITRYKTISNMSNMLELSEARRRGYDEVIYLNTDGYIAEGCTTNIFWQIGRVIYTPSVECGILPGIMRKVVIERYKALGYLVREGMYELNDIYSADRIFLTSSLLGEITAHFKGR